MSEPTTKARKVRVWYGDGATSKPSRWVSPAKRFSIVRNGVAMVLPVGEWLIGDLATEHAGDDKIQRLLPVVRLEYRK